MKEEMMKIREIIEEIEAIAPLPLQEDYDNAGIQVGDIQLDVTGVLLCLDVTEEVIDEALDLKCNLIISHHPLIFKPLKSITGKTYIERCIQKACKHDLVIYSAHTNLDNAWGGVSFRMAEKLGLQNIRTLSPSPVSPIQDDDDVLLRAGAGAIGELLLPEDEATFLQTIKTVFHQDTLKHSQLCNKKIHTVAVCGGSGAFLLPEAIACEADVFITGEAKYNDFYDVENHILLVVAGHYETEIFTKELFFEVITKKIPTFAVHFSNADTNPVNYI